MDEPCLSSDHSWDVGCGAVLGHPAGSAIPIPAVASWVLSPLAQAHPCHSSACGLWAPAMGQHVLEGLAGLGAARVPVSPQRLVVRSLFSCFHVLCVGSVRVPGRSVLLEGAQMPPNFVPLKLVGHPTRASRRGRGEGECFACHTEQDFSQRVIFPLGT